MIMKIHELIEHLRALDPESDVLVKCDDDLGDVIFSTKIEITADAEVIGYLGDDHFTPVYEDDDDDTDLPRRRVVTIDGL